MIFQSGIKSVFYKEEYRDTQGIDFLSKGGVDVTRYVAQD
jgi:deoxycytidylate deaminase